MKVFYVGSLYFINESLQQQLTEQIENHASEQNLESRNENDFLDDSQALNYFPNELKMTPQFFNEASDTIINGDTNTNRKLLQDFFRSITLCNQACVIRNQEAAN